MNLVGGIKPTTGRANQYQRAVALTRLGGSTTPSLPKRQGQLDPGLLGTGSSAFSPLRVLEFF